MDRIATIGHIGSNCAEAAAKLIAAGRPVSENFRGTLPVKCEETTRRYRESQRLRRNSVEAGGMWC